MPLPLSVTGRVVVDGLRDTARVGEQLERALEALRAKRIDRQARRIVFTGGIFRRASSHNLLGPISTGQLTIELLEDGVQVVYELGFSQTFFVTLVMVLGFMGPVVLTATNLSSTEAWGILGVLWLWLYGGNVLSTMWRFPRWIRRTLQESA